MHFVQVMFCWPWRRPLGVSVTRTLNGWHDWSRVKHASTSISFRIACVTHRAPLLAIRRHQVLYSLSPAISCQSPQARHQLVGNELVQDNQIKYSQVIIDVIQYSTDQVASLLPIGHFCQNVRVIVMCRYVRGKGFPHRHGFADQVIAYRIALLLKS